MGMSVAPAPPYTAPMRNHAGIYRITVTKPEGASSYYIGQAANFRLRRKAHFGKLRTGKHKNPVLQRAFAKYGEDAFDFSIVLVCQPIKPLLSLYEQAIVDSYDPAMLYNLRLDCVDSLLGVPMSAETKAKIGAANKGRSPSDANRQALKEAHIGRIATAETRAKMSAAGMGNKRSLGVKLTAERKAEISTFFKGKKRPPEVMARCIATRRKNAEERGGWFTEKQLANLVASNAARRGIPHSPEHRAKIGIAQRGRTASPETKAKMSAAQKGRTVSEDHRRKISETLKARARGSAG